LPWWWRRATARQDNGVNKVREIILRGGRTAYVDDADYDRLSAYTWYAVEGRRGNWYAQRQWDEVLPDGTRKHFAREMQRDVLDPKMTATRWQLSDHINHDTLDNQSHNLRWADPHVSALNRRLMLNNKSGFRGVHFDSGSGSYRAGLMCRGVRYFSRGHLTAEDAARAYNALAAEHHGEHAQLNVIEDDA
jgi:hypothetical protein